MAIGSAQITVTTAATRLVTSRVGAWGASSILVRNRGDDAVYLGDSEVTAITGYQLDATEAVSVDLASGDSLYGISEADPVACQILQAGA
jgi:hypothetical protein